MKKRILLAAAALALSLSLPALAAEEPAIQVQLDGQNLPPLPRRVRGHGRRGRL